MKVSVAILPMLCLGAPSPTPIVNDRPTLHGITEQVPELSVLNEIYRKTEMKFKVEQSRDTTILMPTNEAFEQIDLKPLTYPDLVRILNYHNFPEVVKFGELRDGSHSLETVEGSHILVDINHDAPLPEDRFILNGNARVVGEFYDTVNGVAYVIDRVLIPEDMLDTVEAVIETTARPKKITRPVEEALPDLDVPTHIQQSNRENNRYDERPATTDRERNRAERDRGTVPPELIGGVEPVVRRAQKKNHSGSKRAGLLPAASNQKGNREQTRFLHSRSRAPAVVHTVGVLKHGQVSREKRNVPHTAPHSEIRVGVLH